MKHVDWTSKLAVFSCCQSDQSFGAVVDLSVVLKTGMAGDLDNFEVDINKLNDEYQPVEIFEWDRQNSSFVTKREVGVCVDTGSSSPCFVIGVASSSTCFGTSSSED